MKQEAVYSFLCKAYRCQQDQAVEETYCEASLFEKIQTGLEKEYQQAQSPKKVAPVRKKSFIRHFSVGVGLAASLLFGVQLFLDLPSNSLSSHLVQVNSQSPKIQLSNLTFQARQRLFDYPLRERMAVRAAMHPIGWSTLGGVMASYVNYSPYPH